MGRRFLAGIAVVLLFGFIAMVAAVHLQARQEARQDDSEGAVGSAPRGPAKVMTVKVEPRQPKTVKVEVPVDRATHGDTPAFRGEGWFQQNCSVCHVGLWEKQGQGKPPALSLTGVLKGASAAREAAVRAQIQKGSQNMPGFQNTFTSTQFEELITYLKTL
jgi:mono/diheme cytochrome c family protein